MLVLVVDGLLYLKNLLYFFQHPICTNQNTVDQLAERIINETNSAVSCLTLYLGHKLDLFNSLRKEGPITSKELVATNMLLYFPKLFYAQIGSY